MVLHVGGVQTADLLKVLLKPETVERHRLIHRDQNLLILVSVDQETADQPGWIRDER